MLRFLSGLTRATPSRPRDERCKPVKEIVRMIPRKMRTFLPMTILPIAAGGDGCGNQAAINAA